MFISSFIKNKNDTKSRLHNNKIVSLCLAKGYLPAVNLTLRQALKKKAFLVNRRKGYYLSSINNLEQAVSFVYDFYEYDCEILKLQIDVARNLFKNLVTIRKKRVYSIVGLKNLLKRNFTESSHVILYTFGHILSVVGYHMGDNPDDFEIYVSKTLQREKTGSYFKLNIKKILSEI
jgi:hypothetical protein